MRAGIILGALLACLACSAAFLAAGELLEAGAFAASSVGLALFFARTYPTEGSTNE